jgi:putative ABC transport system permease protein
VQSYATSSLPLGPALKAEAAEVEAVARVLNPKWLSEKVLLGHGNQRFYEERFFFADPAVFELFTYSFLLGDPRTALSKTNAVVISQQMARKYFGAR